MPRKPRDNSLYGELISVGLRDPFIRGIVGLVVIALAASFAISTLGSGPKAIITLALSLSFGVILVILRAVITNIDNAFVKLICFTSVGVIVSVFLVFAVFLIPAAFICWPPIYAAMLGLTSCAQEPSLVVKDRPSSHSSDETAVEPFDGMWNVSLAGNESCAYRSLNFRMVIRNGTIPQSFPEAGTVDRVGNFRFASPAKANPNITVHYEGKLSGNVGYGNYNVAPLGSCSGTMTLNRVGPVP